MTKKYLNQYRKPDIRINNISNNSLNASANESKYIKSAIKRSNANNMSNNSLNATTNESKYIKSANAAANPNNYLNPAANPNNYLNPATNPNNYLSATAANNQSNNIRIRHISIQNFLSKNILVNITNPKNNKDINKAIIELLILCNKNNKVDNNFMNKFLKVIKIFCETKDIKLICSIMVSFLLFSSNNSVINALFMFLMKKYPKENYQIYRQQSNANNIQSLNIYERIYCHYLTSIDNAIKEYEIKKCNECYPNLIIHEDFTLKDIKLDNFPISDGIDVNWLP
jgi:hypothetical protein